MTWCLRNRLVGLAFLLANTVLCLTASSTSGKAASLALPGQFRSQRPNAEVAQRGLPDSNRERFIQPQPFPSPSSPKEDDELLTTPEETQAPQEQPGADVQIDVTRIDVTGSTIFGSKEFDPITKPLEGRTVTLAELNNAANEITRLYLAQGYITSRAVVSPQDIVGGVVQIQVIEGNLSDIQISGTGRLKPDYVRERLELGVDTPLNINDLEDQLQLLQANPLIETIEANLQAGQGLGQSELIVDVERAGEIFLNPHIDNYTTPSTGPVRLGVGVGTGNLTGHGDSFRFAYDGSVTGGLNIFDISYSVPINAKDGTFQLRAIIERDEITEEPFDILEIGSDSERYSLSFRQPIIRSPRQEFALSLGFSHQRSQGFFG